MVTLSKEQLELISNQEYINRKTTKSGDAIAALASERARRADRPIDEYRSRSERINVVAGAVRTGMDLGSWIKIFLVGFLLVFFWVGLGGSAILQILGSMNLWLWIGAIFVGLLWWRNK